MEFSLTQRAADPATGGTVEAVVPMAVDWVWGVVVVPVGRVRVVVPAAVG